MSESEKVRAPTDSAELLAGPDLRVIMRWQSYAHVFRSAPLYGADRILKGYLGLPPEHVMPLTVPHGVDSYLNHIDLDLHTLEPLYLAVREDIAVRVSAYKRILRFPHPWLLMNPLVQPAAPNGTLFIAPPPSADAFEQLHRAMEVGDYPRPWSILLKERGITRADFEWWEARGVETRSAGSIQNPAFYYHLRDAIARSDVVAAVNMSSAVIFAAAMGKRTTAVPGIHMEVVDIPSTGVILNTEDRGGKVRDTWTRLLSCDMEIARAKAHELLGHRYLDTPERLRKRYLHAVASLDRKAYLPPLRGGFVQRSVEAMIERGLPLHRAFPNPTAKIAHQIKRALRRDTVAVIRGSDLAHYGVAGDPARLEVEVVRRIDLGDDSRPGFAVRNSAGTASSAVRG